MSLLTCNSQSGQAQAIVHRATLVTFNPDDFSDIPGLSSLVWRSS